MNKVDEARERLTDREAVARIIDPEAWEEYLLEDGRVDQEVASIFQDAYETSLAKADAILNLRIGEEPALTDADRAWLLRLVKRQEYSGHCGEENAEIRARRDNDDRIERVLKALSPLSSSRQEGEGK